MTERSRAMLSDWVGVDDDALLDALGALLAGTSEPPDEVVRAAEGMFLWRTVDAELAVLTFDSLFDSLDATTGVRAEGGPRMLEFSAGDHVLDVQVVAEAGGRRLVGQVSPPGGSRVRLDTADGRVDTAPDDLGRFAVGLPPAPEVARLRWTTPGGDEVVSSAVLL